MKPKAVKQFDHLMREDRIRESNNGRTLSTRVQRDKKKSYKRKKKNLNDPSLFVNDKFFIGFRERKSLGL